MTFIPESIAEIVVKKNSHDCFGMHVIAHKLHQAKYDFCNCHIVQVLILALIIKHNEKYGCMYILPECIAGIKHKRQKKDATKNS